MKLYHSIPAIGMAICLSQCGPESQFNPTEVVPPQPIIPVGAETSFVNDLRGSKVDFEDKHGEKSYKLSRIGTYTAATLSHNHKHSEQSSGIFIYQKTGPKTGKLVFDITETWELKFTSAHRATAHKSGEKRSYTFEFEWM